ncbi:MAG: CPBP family glutamic-type intramembrane protease [Candidatus Kariarchaeaceae archaeon]|jgi:hypothetical protein
MKSDNEIKWKIEFTILILLTAIFSGIAYTGQNYLFENFVDLPKSKLRITFSFVRCIRMILLYVIPAIWFTYRWGGSIGSIGLLPKRDAFFRNIVLGLIVYSVAVIIFLRNRIFFSGWSYLEWDYVWLNFILVAIMASITDFWTRGFILFELARKTNDAIAIFWQNVTWFVIHIYEIELLEPYIGYFNAIFLTLFLGIGGDLVALKTRSIFGLMLGHIFLNLMILLAAKDVIVLF